MAVCLAWVDCPEFGMPSLHQAPQRTLDIFLWGGQGEGGEGFPKMKGGELL